MARQWSLVLAPMAVVVMMAAIAACRGAGDGAARLTPGGEASADFQRRVKSQSPSSRADGFRLAVGKRALDIPATLVQEAALPALQDPDYDVRRLASAALWESLAPQRCDEPCFEAFLEMSAQPGQGITCFGVERMPERLLGSTASAGHRQRIVAVLLRMAEHGACLNEAGSLLHYLGAPAEIVVRALKAGVEGPGEDGAGMPSNLWSAIRLVSALEPLDDESLAWIDSHAESSVDEVPEVVAEALGRACSQFLPVQAVAESDPVAPETAPAQFVRHPGLRTHLHERLVGLLRGERGLLVQEAAIHGVQESPLPCPDLVPLLTGLLGDERGLGRGAAVRALGRQGPAAAGAVPRLICLLGEDGGPPVLLALKNIGPGAVSAAPEVVASLTPLLAHSDDYYAPNTYAHLWQWGCEALAAMGASDAATVAFLASNSRESHWFVRRPCTRALGAVAPPTAEWIRPLVDWACTDGEVGDRAADLDALVALAARGGDVRSVVQLRLASDGRCASRGRLLALFD